MNVKVAQMRAVNVTLSAPLVKRANDLAAKEGVSLSEVIRMALRDLLERKEIPG